MSHIQTLLIHRPFSGEPGLACSPGFFIHFFWTKKTSDTVFFISGSSSCHPPIDQASGEGDNSNCNGGDSMSTYFCLLMAITQILATFVSAFLLQNAVYTTASEFYFTRRAGLTSITE